MGQADEVQVFEKSDTLDTTANGVVRVSVTGGAGPSRTWASSRRRWGDGDSYLERLGNREPVVKAGFCCSSILGLAMFILFLAYAIKMLKQTAQPPCCNDPADNPYIWGLWELKFTFGWAVSVHLLTLLIVCLCACETADGSDEDKPIPPVCIVIFLVVELVIFIVHQVLRWFVQLAKRSVCLPIKIGFDSMVYASAALKLSTRAILSRRHKVDQESLTCIPSSAHLTDLPSTCPMYVPRRSPKPFFDGEDFGRDHHGQLYHAQTRTECHQFRHKACCTAGEADNMVRLDNLLRGATNRCDALFSSLRCWACAPHQHMFFQNHTITICGDFCDDLYSACASASWVIGGPSLSSLHSGGKDLCQYMGLKILNTTTRSCDCYRGNPPRDPSDDFNTLRRPGDDRDITNDISAACTIAFTPMWLSFFILMVIIKLL